MGAQETLPFFRQQGFATGGSPQNPVFQVDLNGNATFGAAVNFAGATNLSGSMNVTGTFSIPNLLNSTTALAATVTALAASPAVASVITGASTSANLVAVSQGANASGAHLFGLKTRTTTGGGAATTTIVTADVLFSIHAAGADGTNYVDSAGIQFISSGTIATGRVPSQIRFFTGTDVTTTVKTEALRIDEGQNVKVGNLTGSLLAQGATGGFLCIPGCATGKPNGTPGILLTGTLPLVFDTVGAKISVYSGGAWIQTAALT